MPPSTEIKQLVLDLRKENDLARPPPRLSKQDRLTRWRLILGEPASQSCGELTGTLVEIDEALCGLYGGGDGDSQRKGGLGSSSPKVNRWLGDIRKYFPESVVQVMQRDAVERLRMRQLLLEPELLESLESDVHLVATLVSLSQCPDLLVAAIQKKDISMWVSENVISDSR